jgi:hypothetical protein
MPQLGPSSSATTVSLFSLLITAYTGTQSAAARPSSGGSNIANVSSPAACSAVKQSILTGMTPAADAVCVPHAAGCPHSEVLPEALKSMAQQGEESTTQHGATLNQLQALLARRQ